MAWARGIQPGIGCSESFPHASGHVSGAKHDFADLYGGQLVQQISQEGFIEDFNQDLGSVAHYRSQASAPPSDKNGCS